MIYQGSFNIEIVILSIVIAILSSFASFQINSRIVHNKEASSKIWLLLGTIITALGIWTMHFTGMLSVHSSMNITYYINLTILSFLVTIICTFPVIFILSRTKANVLSKIIALTIMGIGITVMHIIGVISMRVDAKVHFNIDLILLGFILAVCVSYGFVELSIYIDRSKIQSVRKKLMSSILIGTGIASVHYLQMAAVTLTKIPPSEDPNKIITFSYFSNPISTEILAFLLGLSIFIVIVTIIAIIYYEKNIAEKLQQISEIHYNSLFENNPSLIFTLDKNGVIIGINPMGLEMLKCTKETVISKTLFSFFMEEEQHSVKNRFQHLLDEERRKFESKMKDARGNWIPMHIALVPIMIHGEMNGAFVIASDTSELTKSKERIKKAQKDLFNTIRRQQGMTIKFVKIGKEFIHTLGEGQLLGKLGLTPAMLVGKSLYDIFPKQEADIRFRAYDKAWDGEITTYEANLNGVDYFATLSPVIQNGKVKEVIISGADITKRKKAERVLAKSEKFYMNILSVMNEGIYIHREDGSNYPLNENAFKMLGINRAIFDKVRLDLLTNHFTDKDDNPLIFENLPLYITLKTGRSFTGEIIGFKRNGKRAWLLVNTKLIEPHDQSGSPQVLVTMSDITFQKEIEIQLKESNALRRTIIDSLPIGMIVIDNDRKIAALNKPCFQLFNIQGSVSDVVGKSVIPYYESFYLESDVQMKRINEIMSNKITVIDEVKLWNNRIVKRTYFPFYMDGELKGHLWTFDDITERKKLEEQIIISREEAVKANLAKSDFLSKVSHELRTPLNGILGFSQLLEMDETLTIKQSGYVQEVLKGGRHLLSLINDILELSRIEAGKLKLSITSMKVVPIVNECLNLISSSAFNKNIHIFNQLHKCAEQYVLADQVKLKQIILNLLDNAVKYNRENGEIFISCECRDDHLILHIKDSGIGIPFAEQARIFEPFYRIEHVHNEGTGIGLALVKQFIQLMGGEAGVESRINMGSDFWISIPASQSFTADQHHLIEKRDRFLALQKDYRILYIEDNLLNLQLVTDIFNMVPGVTLFTSMNGKEGIEIVKEQQINLILLDLQLGEMNGFQVFEYLLSNRLIEDIPVLALSANAMPDNIHLALSKGFDDYITKPINVSEFLGVIAKYLA
jgi:PAS domain S-box-containing protein